MKKTFLRIGIAAAILLLALFLAVWGVERYVESLVLAQIRLLDEHTAGECEVETVNYELLSRKITITGFRIMNPPGYRRMAALRAARITITVSPLALCRKLVHVRKFQIEGVTLNFELHKIPKSLQETLWILIDRKFNLCELIIDPDDGKTRGVRRKNTLPRRSADSTTEPWRIRVDDFRLSSASVTIGNAPQLADDLMHILEPLRKVPAVDLLCRQWEEIYAAEIEALSTFNIPNIREKDLGAPDGLTPDRLIGELLERQQAAITGELKKRLTEFQEKIRKLFGGQSEKVRRWLAAAKGRIDGIIEVGRRKLNILVDKLKDDPNGDSLKQRILVKAIELAKDKLDKLLQQKKLLDDAEAGLDRMTGNDGLDAKP